MTPTFLERVTGFTISFRDWFKAGFPWRNPDETRELFETHCKPCPHYNPDRVIPIWPAGYCEACGCHVSGEPTEILNKVNKPHLGCPLKKWLPVVELPDE